MIENIINGLMAKFMENPEAWIGFWTLCGINLFLLIKYVMSNDKKWLLFGFAGMYIAIYIMLCLIIIQNMV